MSRRTCSAVMLATRVHCHPLQKSTSNKFNTSSLTLTRFTTRKACVLRWTSIISQKRSLFSNSTNLTACSHLPICRLTNRTDKTFCRQEKIDRNTLLQSLLICIGRKSAKVFFCVRNFCRTDYLGTENVGRLLDVGKCMWTGSTTVCFGRHCRADMPAEKRYCRPTCGTDLLVRFVSR